MPLVQPRLSEAAAEGGSAGLGAAEGLAQVAHVLAVDEAHAGLDAGGRGDLARDVLDLTCAASAGQPELLPWYAAALERLPAYVSDSGYHPLGLPVLREALARRFTERGVPTGPEQIIVTTGALAGLSVVARAYVGSGDRVLFENPSYPGGMAAMRHAGARLVGIPAEGGLAASAATVITSVPVARAPKSSTAV